MQAILQAQPIMRYGMLTPKEAARDIKLDSAVLNCAGFFSSSNVRSMENIDQARINQHLVVATNGLSEATQLDLELPISLFMVSGDMEYSGKWRALFAKAYPELGPFFKQSD